ADDDRAGAGAFLRRTGAAEKHARNHDAEFFLDGVDYGDVGPGGLQLVLWRQRAGDWRIRTRVPARRGRGAKRGLRGDDSPDDVHGVPVDVCRDYACADYQGDVRADEI